MDNRVVRPAARHQVGRVASRAAVLELDDVVDAVGEQLRPVLLSLQDRRLPLPRQILKGGRIGQRLVELSTKTLGARDQWARGGG
jgi:hypothetical protein